MLTFRIVENILSDGSCSYDVAISDGDGASLRLHACTLADAERLTRDVRALIGAHTVDLTEEAWHGAN